MEVFEGGELDEDLAFAFAELDFDAGFEAVGELLLQGAHAGCLEGGAGAWLWGRGVEGGTAEFDPLCQLLGLADGQAFGHDAVRQALLLLGILEPGDGAGVAG